MKPLFLSVLETQGSCTRIPRKRKLRWVATTIGSSPGSCVCSSPMIGIELTLLDPPSIHENIWKHMKMCPCPKMIELRYFGYVTPIFCVSTLVWSTSICFFWFRRTGLVLTSCSALFLNLVHFSLSVIIWHALMDWFEGRSAGNHECSHIFSWNMFGGPVKFPLKPIHYMLRIVEYFAPAPCSGCETRIRESHEHILLQAREIRACDHRQFKATPSLLGWTQDLLQYFKSTCVLRWHIFTNVKCCARGSANTSLFSYWHVKCRCIPTCSYLCWTMHIVTKSSTWFGL